MGLWLGRDAEVGTVIVLCHHRAEQSVLRHFTCYSPLSHFHVSPEATVIPQPCGNVTLYCPSGSTTPSPVMDGYYTAVAPGVATNATDTMALALDCPPGSYCSSGVRHLCPSGTFQSDFRVSNASACEVCAPGGFCPEGSSGPLPCGNDTVYCPAGAAAPTKGVTHLGVVALVKHLLVPAFPCPACFRGCAFVLFPTLRSGPWILRDWP